MQMIEHRTNHIPHLENNQKETEVEARIYDKRVNGVGSIELPSREVQPHIPNLQQPNIDLLGNIAHIAEINVIMAEANTQLLGDLPEPAPSSIHPSIYTHQTDPFNAARVKEIKRKIKLGDDLTAEELEELNEFIVRNTDVFALALKEVLPIPGAMLNLNVPSNTTFNGPRRHLSQTTTVERPQIHLHLRFHSWVLRNSSPRKMAPLPGILR